MNSFVKFFISHKKRIIISAIIFVAVGAIATGSIVAANNYYAKRLPDGAELNGVSIEGLTVEELDAVIKDKINPQLRSTEVTLSFNGTEKTVTAEDFDFSYDAETVFNEAKHFDFTESKTDFTPAQNCDKEKIKETLEAYQEETRVTVVPYSYEQNEEIIQATAGSAGMELDVEQCRRDLVDQINNHSLNPETVLLESVEITDDTIAINIDAIYEEVHQDVQDASYSISSSGVLSYSQESSGVSFDLEQAKKTVSDASNGTYTIPLVFTSPSVTVAQLKQEHTAASCPDLLYSFTTTFSASDANRNFNIARAASILSGTVLYSGEKFSFSDIVGYTNQANGYKEATVYTSAGTDTGYGGGVCQVSTTVYNAALFSYMKITERHNHSYTVGYVPLGQDAAVSDGGYNMCFINTRNNPIKVVASTTSNSITVSIYGTKSEMDNYKVSLAQASSSSISPGVEYRDTSDLSLGQERVIQNAKVGYNVSLSKTVTYNGAVIETSTINSSYKALNKIVERGTTAVATPAPAPEQSSEESQAADR